MRKIALLFMALFLVTGCAVTQTQPEQPVVTQDFMTEWAGYNVGLFVAQENPEIATDLLPIAQDMVAGTVSASEFAKFFAKLDLVDIPADNPFVAGNMAYFMSMYFDTGTGIEFEVGPEVQSAAKGFVDGVTFLQTWGQ